MYPVSRLCPVTHPYRVPKWHRVLILCCVRHTPPEQLRKRSWYATSLGSLARRFVNSRDVVFVLSCPALPVQYFTVRTRCRFVGRQPVEGCSCSISSVCGQATVNSKAHGTSVGCSADSCRRSTSSIMTRRALAAWSCAMTTRICSHRVVKQHAVVQRTLVLIL